MLEKTYFQRVQEQSPTRFWINNPTLEQAKKAIEAGAVGCTTNPSYVSKLFNSPEDFGCVLRSIDLLLPYEPNDSIVAAKVQRVMVSRLSEVFMPLFRQSEGKLGLVTIQCDPYHEEDADFIINDGVSSRKIGANITVKIPVTAPGIKAIKTLVEKNVPTMATEIMAVAQAVSICEAYQEASKQSGNIPPFFVTHITGILDDHFKRVVAGKTLGISPEAMKFAGLTVAKKQYALLKERNYPGIMLGGGARKLEDFTELVGGDLHITINWDGMAEVLIKQDPPVVRRIEAALAPPLVTELLEKLPDFARAYNTDGLKVEEYYDYGAVELFRSSFMKGWRSLLDLIAERRRML